MARIAVKWPWTPHEEELLERQWARGISASVIALRLGAHRTKNSVIGKARRMGLEPRPSPITRRTE